MQKKDLSKVYYLLIAGVTAAAVAGGIFFFSGIPRENWFELLLIIVLFVYLHAETVATGADPSNTLSATVIFPVIYIYGTTPGMLISVLAGVVDGRVKRRDLPRTLFNSAQLALGSLINSLLFIRLGGGLPGIVAGATANIAVNTLLVSLVVAIWSGTSWWSVLSRAGIKALQNNVGTAFIGIIFALILGAYRFWGLLTFGLFLIYLSQLFKLASKFSGERTMRRELEEELLVDEMTQAYNFRFLSEWLNDPSQEEVAVLYLDIDDFKVFNDLYSHAEGDQVLKALVETVSNSVRADDKVIRYGGDEFVVLLPGMGRTAAYSVAERIVTNLEELSFATWQHKITVSIGIATYPHDTSDKRQLLLMADQAMYQAKDAGKDRIRMWAPQKDLA